MTNPKAIGERIRRLMMENEVNDLWLQKKARLPHQAMQAIALDMYVLFDEEIDRIATALDCSVEDLTG